MKSSYDKFPCVQVSGDPNECTIGWPAIWSRVAAAWSSGTLCIECYPGVFESHLLSSLAETFPGAAILSTDSCFLPAAAIDKLLAHELTSDRVFGRLTSFSLSDLFNPASVRQFQARMHGAKEEDERVIVVGTGASLLAPGYALLAYADLARWEIQRRQRGKEIPSLGMNNANSSASELYRRGFFVDWRVADQLKRSLLPTLDFLLDTNDRAVPKLISGEAFRGGLALTVQRPFRVVPFFDPGPWGGQWMREVCDLPEGPPNYAWCFDCVPEENSLLLGFGEHRVEVPAQDLVYAQGCSLLGDAVYGRFGAEFPIRFDFLDTMGGGNLSLQVHPLTEYIQQHFGMHYTQDESYYLLDSAENACVYLGFKQAIDRPAFVAALQEAQAGGAPMPVETFVNRFPARKHDHFLIPAGTIHCSGRNSMVLEISATPFIFTFKLWDWGRLGLDGLARPIHIEHGVRNLQWERDTCWVRTHLMPDPEPVTTGEGWREERTGLHAAEFIETRRHWFTRTVPHHTQDSVAVLNLVEGDQVIVESPTHAFASFLIHYAETFIVPAAVGPYTIAPAGHSPQYATVKAFVRTRA